MLEHAEAVRIAQGGEGAVVGELVRLSKEVDLWRTLAESRERRIGELLEGADTRLEDVTAKWIDIARMLKLSTDPDIARSTILSLRQTLDNARASR